MNKAEHPKQLSKEFFRQWLISNNFQGKENQTLPLITEEIIHKVSERYIELYNTIIGKDFIPRNSSNILSDVEKEVVNFLN